MPEVVVRGFGWRHAGRRSWALRGVDLRVREGERVLLLGPSGAGKSTLLAALAGLLPADSGESEGSIAVDDSRGLLFQDPQTQLVMARSGDDVAFGLENHGVPAGEIWPRVSDALDRVGFPYPLGRRTSALSGGEQQRLALAGILALRPGLVLLDEPTANLDPAGAEIVRTAVARALTPGTTLIVVEHRVAEALPLVDRAVVLEPGGGVVADGAPEVVFAGHGPSLAARGVWVPGFDLPHHRAVSPPADSLVRASRLEVRGRLPLVESIDVRAGEALAVTGPNGAGKSTLALVLGGLLAPTSGRVTAFNDPRPPHKWRAATLAARTGSVFQSPEHQFVTSRVRDELALGPQRLGHPAVHSVVDSLLSRLRLTALADANPHTLSGGEARRLSVATALATAPRLLILDEPTFGQDRQTWIELVSLLADLRNSGHGIITITHDDALVSSLSDRVHDLTPPTPLPRRRPDQSPLLTATTRHFLPSPQNSPWRTRPNDPPPGLRDGTWNALPHALPGGPEDALPGGSGKASPRGPGEALPRGPGEASPGALLGGPGEASPRALPGDPPGAMPGDHPDALPGHLPDALRDGSSRGVPDNPAHRRGGSCSPDRPTPDPRNSTPNNRPDGTPHGHRDGTTNSHHDSTKEGHLDGLSRGSRNGPSGGHRDPTSGEHHGSTTNGHRDSTSGGHHGGTTGGHHDSTTNGHRDSTSGGHHGGTSGGHSDSSGKPPDESDFSGGAA